MTDLTLLKARIDHFWGWRIEQYQIDLKAHTISLRLENGLTKGDITFGGVTSCYYVHWRDNTPRALETWDFLELTAIYFFDKQVNQVRMNNVQRPEVTNSSSANFVLEMWNLTMYLEVESITIDEERFDVGYPRSLNT